MTLVTGLVDAASYLGLGHVFAASMTGTVVLLGFSLPRAAELSPGVLLVALIAFVAGAIAGGRLAAIAAMCVGAAIGAILLRFGLAAPLFAAAAGVLASGVACLLYPRAGGGLPGVPITPASPGR